MTHTPSEWASVLSLATGLFGTSMVPFFLLVDADRSDFDPRLLLDTDAGARLLVEIVRARYVLRDAAVGLLLHTSPKGADR